MQFYEVHTLLIKYLLNCVFLPEEPLSDLKKEAIFQVMTTDIFPRLELKSILTDPEKSTVLNILLSTQNVSTSKENLNLLKRVKVQIKRRLFENTNLKDNFAPLIQLIDKHLYNPTRIISEIKSILPFYETVNDLIIKKIQNLPDYKILPLPFLVLAKRFKVDVHSTKFRQISLYCEIASEFENNGTSLDQALKLSAIFMDARNAFEALDTYANQKEPGGESRKLSQFVHDACNFELPASCPAHWSKWQTWMREDLSDKVFANCFAAADILEAFYKNTEGGVAFQPFLIDQDAAIFYQRECLELNLKLVHSLSSATLQREIQTIHDLIEQNLDNKSRLKDLISQLHKRLKSYVRVMMAEKISFHHLNEDANMGLQLLMKETLSEKVKEKRKALKLTQHNATKEGNLNQTLAYYLQAYVIELKATHTPFERLNRDAILGLSLLYKKSVKKSASWLIENGITMRFVEEFEMLDKSKAGINIPNLLFTSESMPGYYFRKLNVAENSHDAAIAAILGRLTDCCQYIGGSGHDCATHGLTNPNGGFYVLFEGDILYPKASDLIIAQSWVWRGTHGELVFDSIEYSKTYFSNPPIGKVTLLTQYYLEACGYISRSSPDVTKINLGRGGNTPLNIGIQAKKAAIPLEYDGYSDAEKQYALFNRDVPFLYWVINPTPNNKQLTTEYFRELLDTKRPLNHNLCLTKLIQFFSEQRYRDELNQLVQCVTALFNQYGRLRLHSAPQLSYSDLFQDRIRWILNSLLNLDTFSPEEQVNLCLFLHINFQYQVKIREPSSPLSLIEYINHGAMPTLVDFKDNTIFAQMPLNLDIFKSFTEAFPIELTLHCLSIHNTNGVSAFRYSMMHEKNGFNHLCFDHWVSLFSGKQLITLIEASDSPFDRENASFFSDIISLDAVLKKVVSVYQKEKVHLDLNRRTGSHSTLFEIAVHHINSLKVILNLIPNENIQPYLNLKRKAKSLLEQVEDPEAYTLLLSCVPVHLRLLFLKDNMHYRAVESQPNYIEPKFIQNTLTLLPENDIPTFIQSFSLSFFELVQKWSLYRNVINILTEHNIEIMLNLKSTCNSNILHYGYQVSPILISLMELNRIEKNIELILEKNSRGATPLLLAGKHIYSLNHMLSLLATPEAKLSALLDFCDDGNILTYAAKTQYGFKEVWELIPNDELKLKLITQSFEDNSSVLKEAFRIPEMFPAFLALFPVDERYKIIDEYGSRFNPILKELITRSKLKELFNLLTLDECYLVVTNRSVYNGFLERSAQYPESMKEILNLTPPQERFVRITQKVAGMGIFDDFATYCANQHIEIFLIILSFLPENDKLRLILRKHQDGNVLTLILDNEFGLENMVSILQLLPHNSLKEVETILCTYYNLKQMLIPNVIQAHFKVIGTYTPGYHSTPVNDNRIFEADSASNIPKLEPS